MCEVRFDKQGSVLMMSLVLGVAVIILVFAVLSFAYTSVTFTAQNTTYINSLMVSESALNHTLRLFNKNPDVFGYPPLMIDEVFPYEGQELIAWLRDTAPGYVDGDMKMILQSPDYVIGVGTDKEYTRVVRAKYINMNVEGSPGAIYIEAPEVRTVYAGNAFLIDGNDHDVNGFPVVGGDKPGIVATTDQAVADLMPGGKGEDNIIGSTPSPSIEADTSVPVDIGAISDSLVDFADELYTGYTEFTGNLTFGGVDDPTLVVVDGDLRVTGTVEGWGILLVKGNFRWFGTMTWTGLIIVDGGTEAGGDTTEGWGNGTPDVIGAMWLKAPTDLAFEVKGNPSIVYSSEALELLASLGIVVDRSSWQEL